MVRERDERNGVLKNFSKIIVTDNGEREKKRIRRTLFPIGVVW